MPEWVDATTLVTELCSDAPPTVLDVREPAEWAGEYGIIEGAVLCSSTKIHEWVTEIVARTDESLVVTCRTHGRSPPVARILAEGGHPDVRVLRDGMMNWSNSGFPHVAWDG